MIDIIFIPSRYAFFTESPTKKNFEVKRACPVAILEWVTDQEVFSSAYK
jgi:hypothetical protein